MFSIVLFLQYIQHNGHMIKLLIDSLSTVEPEGKIFGCYCAQSVQSFVCMLGPYVLTIFFHPALPVSQ